jgi:hypothetical protein
MSMPAPPEPDYEHADLLYAAAVIAIERTLADGKAQGRQPGEWADGGRGEEHEWAILGHAQDACIPEREATDKIEHLRHCLTRCAMALTLLEET